MWLTQSNIKFKTLDSYSMLITSKYLQSTQDYINIICVCKKFKETTEKLRFNPISITSLKLFPMLQTQYLYDENDIKIKGINKYEIWYKVDYEQYLKHKQDNIKIHNVTYTIKNRSTYGDTIPDCVNTLSPDYFYECLSLTSINLPSKITSIGDECFGYCTSLQSIDLPSSLQSLGNFFFGNCYSLKEINLPPTLKSLGSKCFNNCSSLTTINLPSSITTLGDHCFNQCSSLTSINLPSSITSLCSNCFSNCTSLVLVNLPLSMKSLDNNCFSYCINLKSIHLPSTLTSLGGYCFSYCVNLQTINLPYGISIGNNCFYGCYKTKYDKEHLFCIIS